MGEEREKLLENLKEGTVVKGIVKNITDYGAFVDLGGIDGLLHITDLAWRRVVTRRSAGVGDEVTAKVLKFDQEKNRVSLGLKQLGEDPWVGISRRYPQGTRLFGKVTNLTDYGASSRSSRASKAWCTSPKWTGPTRTSTRPRSSSWATKSK
jgi:small subunit ribosomal protein S1